MHPIAVTQALFDRPRQEQLKFVDQQQLLTSRVTQNWEEIQ